MLDAFDARRVRLGGTELFLRMGGEGPPLLLLHGYPQTNVMYHRVAPALAKRFTLVIPDLPGYGWSAVPASDADHTPYTKRAMAAVMVEVVEAAGFAQFRLAGHDRGGRVAYGLRSTIRAASPSSPCSISCRLTTCGAAWTTTWRCGCGTGRFLRSPSRCPKR